MNKFLEVVEEKTNYLKKKWSWDGDILKYQEDEGVIYINPVLDCIYDANPGAIYCMYIAMGCIF